jgi:hypothetical protein
MDIPAKKDKSCHTQSATDTEWHKSALILDFASGVKRLLRHSVYKLNLRDIRKSVICRQASKNNIFSRDALPYVRSLPIFLTAYTGPKAETVLSSKTSVNF